MSCNRRAVRNPVSCRRRAPRDACNFSVRPGGPMRLNRVVSGCLLLGMMVMTLLTDGASTEPATRAARPATEPSGASLAFTTDDPVVGRARGLVAEGRFA